jgi:hypothetical protein
MKEIPLTQGKVAIVDDEDFEELSKVKWCAQKSKDTFYAVRGLYRSDKKTKGQIIMHRVILDAPTDKFVDHINGDGLDNRRENLRLCSHAENQRNKGKQKNNTSGFKGVCWHKRSKKWYVQIMADKKLINVGLFTTLEEAVSAHKSAALKYHGEFARVREPITRP